MPFPNIGPGELILILIIALVVLGPGKLPDVASSLGKSVREFRKAASDVQESARLDPSTPPAAPSTAQAQAAVPAPPVAAPAAPVSETPPPAPGPSAEIVPPESTEPAAEPDRS